MPKHRYAKQSYFLYQICILYGQIFASLLEWSEKDIMDTNCQYKKIC